MNCSAFEQLIALYVEGDLRDSERRHVETHIRGCDTCRNLRDELQESQVFFKSLRQESVHSAALVEVRQRVLNEVGDLEPAPGWVVAMHRLFFAGMRRRTAIAGVLLAALTSGGLWYAQSRVVGERKKEPPIEVARVELPSSVVPADITHLPAPARLVKVIEPLEVEVLDALPVEELVVQLVEESAALDPQKPQIPMKFLTDDPDIIIYWLPQDKGD